MGLNCQLCGGSQCSGGNCAARPATLRRTLALALLLAGCGNDGGGEAEVGTADASTGHDTSTASTAGTGTAGITTSETAPTTGTTDGPGTTDATDSGVGEVGPNFGLLTFTLYSADAAGSPELLGMAGAWRTEPFTTDDFYAVRALGLLAPLAPATADTLEAHEPQVYDWGKTQTWVTLGNGVRLIHPGGDALACLQLVADSYPVYFSDDAAIFDPSCAPDPTQWVPATSYDVVAYGGESFADELRTAAVTTPTPLVVTAPAIDVFDFPLASTEDLALAWQADGGADDRVVIRLWDQFGRQIVVHAADDGSSTVPAAELGKLAPGPVTLTLTREHISEVGFAAGLLRVVARHEVTAYPDLF